MKKRLLVTLLAALLLVGSQQNAYCATGCSLNNPEEDLEFFFKGFSHFTVRYTTFANQNPEGYKALRTALGGELDPVYETRDVPYTLYTVFRNQETLGYAFGANQRGTYSNLQIIAGLDGSGNLRKVYLQKIRSPQAKAFRDSAFLDQLAQIPLDRFPDLLACVEKGPCADTRLPKDPTDGNERDDYVALIRGMAKLHHLRTLLLNPGEYPRDTVGRARLEHSSLLWLPEQEYRPLAQPEKVAVLDVTSPQNVDDRVALVQTPDDSRIYPLSLLTLHPVIEDVVGGVPIAVTWSSVSETLSVLRRGGLEGPNFSHTSNLLFGLQVVLDRTKLQEWDTLQGIPMDAEGQGESDHLLRGHVMTLGEAAVAYPSSRVAISDDPYERHKTLYKEHQKRFHDHDGSHQIALLSSGDDHVMIPLHTVSTPGLYAVTTNRFSMWVVRHGTALYAFEVPEEIKPERLQWRGEDFPRGLPLLAREHAGKLHLWQGHTGFPVRASGAEEAFEPMTVRTLPLQSAIATLGSNLISQEPLAPTKLGGPEEFDSHQFRRFFQPPTPDDP